jgi:hypothetical protein
MKTISTEKREVIFDEINRERLYQDERWGNEFDKLNSPNDWVAYIVSYLGRAVTMPWNYLYFRQALIKVAALCVAALEQNDFAPRHYDDTTYSNGRLD